MKTLRGFLSTPAAALAAGAFLGAVLTMWWLGKIPEASLPSARPAVTSGAVRGNSTEAPSPASLAALEDSAAYPGGSGVPGEDAAIMRLVHGDTVAVPMGKLEPPVGAILAADNGALEVNPGLLTRIGVTPEQEGLLNEKLKEFRERETRLEAARFQVVIKDAHRTVLKIQNTPEEAARNRVELRDFATRALGEEKAALFMGFARDFLDNHSTLFTDSVRVVSLSRQTEEMRKITGAEYYASAATLAKSLLHDGPGGDADSLIRTAFLEQGAPFGAAIFPRSTGGHTSTLPPWLAHLPVLLTPSPGGE